VASRPPKCPAKGAVNEMGERDSYRQSRFAVGSRLRRRPARTITNEGRRSIVMERCRPNLR